MIKKEIKMTHRIKNLQVIHCRLPASHIKRQMIQEDLAKRLAGFKGEQSLDYFFKFLPNQDYYILHNLRLANVEGSYFQIDVLLIATSFYLIIEVKNISGTLTLDPAFDQVIWTNSTTGIEKAIQDPVLQVKHQQFQFTEWLKQKKLPIMPVESIVVLTNQSTILKIISSKKDYLHSIVRSTKLLEKVFYFKEKYSKELITIKEMNKISNQLIKQHTPEKPNLFPLYNIDYSDIVAGVYCENCLALPMKYHRGKWNCHNCSFTSKSSHLKTIEDYVLLYGSLTSNCQIKDFLQLPSDAITYHLLHSMNLKYTGDKKGRKYYLPSIDLD
ncbi:MAG TPA: NERD domain-containing protein [Bacillus bacterium]|nr:NERD domain-containing protein [Bacillus sp. (in: firmicutes)]